MPEINPILKLGYILQGPLQVHVAERVSFGRHTGAFVESFQTQPFSRSD